MMMVGVEKVRRLWEPQYLLATSERGGKIKDGGALAGEPITDCFCKSLYAGLARDKARSHKTGEEPGSSFVSGQTSCSPLLKQLYLVPSSATQSGKASLGQLIILPQRS